MSYNSNDNNDSIMNGTATKTATKAKKPFVTQTPTKPAESADAYITRRAIEGLQNKKCAWRRTWKTANCAPMNFITGNHYNGYNWLIGMIDSAMTGRVPQYATYNQLANGRKGAHVIAGQQSSHKVAFKSVFYKDKDGVTVPYSVAQKMTIKERKEKGISTIPYLRLTPVFHIDQTVGYEDKKVTVDLKQSDFNPIEKAETLLGHIENVLGCVIDRKIGQSASYSPGLDVIKISTAEGFEKTEMYYRTIFHEISHWTGHKDRLDRKIENGFGSDLYSKEELVAELGSQMLMDFCGIDDSETLDISQGYINNWVQRFTEDIKLITECAKKAHEIFKFLVGENHNEDEAE